MSTTLDTPVDAPRRDIAPDPLPFRYRGGPLRVLASLRLTVALFALSMVLVFFGTLAQVDKGIWTVVDQYFRSWYVWVPFQLIADLRLEVLRVPRSWHDLGRLVPVARRWLLGGVMLANLLAATSRDSNCRGGDRESS